MTTASEKKLALSPYTVSEYPSSLSSESESESGDRGKGSRIIEVSGIKSALKAVCCKECGGAISFEEELLTRTYSARAEPKQLFPLRNVVLELWL